jgi:hypothetical protein
MQPPATYGSGAVSRQPGDVWQRSEVVALTGMVLTTIGAVLEAAYRSLAGQHRLRLVKSPSRGYRSGQNSPTPRNTNS